MTLPEKIEEVLKLEAQATPGEWQTNAVPSLGSTANGVFTKSISDGDAEIFVCSVKPRWDEGCAVGDEAIANATFIAAARNIIRPLAQAYTAALTALESSDRDRQKLKADRLDLLAQLESIDQAAAKFYPGEQMQFGEATSRLVEDAGKWKAELAAIKAKWKWLEENLSCDYAMDDEGLPDVTKYEFTWEGSVTLTAGPKRLSELVEAELAKEQRDG